MEASGFTPLKTMAGEKYSLGTRHIGNLKTSAGLCVCVCVYLDGFVILRRGALREGEIDGAEKERNKCWEKVTEEREEIRTQTIVGK